jgi:phosphoacetylglucosamine mutase
VEASLKLLDWNLDEWESVYSELPSYNLKVPSSNKTALKTVWDETVVIEPIEFKNELENLLDQYKSHKGKCLVRASGTEDVIRILTEATTRDIAIELAEHVKELIIRYIG